MSRSGAWWRSRGWQTAEITRARVAAALLKGRRMRALAWLCLLCTGCVLYLGEDKKKKDIPPDAHVVDVGTPECGPAPADAGACDCVYGQWRCNTCPWPSPEPVIACAHVGSFCDYEDWEHGCSCVCDASGFWSCTPETVGSSCPSLPPPDAAPQ